MRPRSSAHQPPASDMVTLPDVGPMTRNELRQLEAALYGQPRRRQELDEQSRVAEGGAIAARRSALRPTRSRRGLVGNSTVASRSVSGPLGSAAARSRSLVSEVSQSPSGNSASDLLDLQLGSREREQHLRHLLDLEGPLGSSSGFSRPSGSSMTGNRPTSSGGPGTGSATTNMGRSPSATRVGFPSSAGAPPRVVRSASQANANGMDHSIPNSYMLGSERSRRLSAGRTNRQTNNSDELIHVPDVGHISRSQLSSLEAVLSGRSDVDNALADLPDLRGMSAQQLQRLEAVLNEDSEREHSASAAVQVLEHEHRPPQHVEASVDSTRQRMPRSPLTTEMLSRPGSPPLPPILGRSSEQQPPDAQLNSTAAPRPATQMQKWRIDEEEFEKLATRGYDVPEGQECAICYQNVSSGAIALPCAKQGCASVFHKNCIRPWLERNPTCPLCRGDLKAFVEPVPSSDPSPDNAMIIELIAAGMGQWLSRHRAMMWLFQQGVLGGDVEDDVGVQDMAGVHILPPWLLASLGEDEDMDPTAFLIAAMAQHASLAANDMQLARQQRVQHGQGARALLEGADLVQTVGRPVHGMQPFQLVTAAELLGYSAPLSTTGLMPPSLSSGTSRQRTAAAHSTEMRSQGPGRGQVQTPSQSMARSASLPQLDHASSAVGRRRMI